MKVEIFPGIKNDLLMLGLHYFVLRSFSKVLYFWVIYSGYLNSSDSKDFLIYH